MVSREDAKTIVSQHPALIASGLAFIYSALRLTWISRGDPQTFYAIVKDAGTAPLILSMVVTALPLLVSYAIITLLIPRAGKRIGSQLWDDPLRAIAVVVLIFVELVIGPVFVILTTIIGTLVVRYVVRKKSDGNETFSFGSNRQEEMLSTLVAENLGRQGHQNRQLEQAEQLLDRANQEWADMGRAAHVDKENAVGRCGLGREQDSLEGASRSVGGEFEQAVTADMTDDSYQRLVDRLTEQIQSIRDEEEAISRSTKEIVDKFNIWREELQTQLMTALAVVILLPILLTVPTQIWVPSENLNINGSGPYSAFVLSSTSEELTIMTVDKHRILTINRPSVTDRSICDSPQVTIMKSLLQLAWGTSSYPKCSDKAFPTQLPGK